MAHFKEYDWNLFPVQDGKWILIIFLQDFISMIKMEMFADAALYIIIIHYGAAGKLKKLLILQGLPFLKIITCPTSRILKFFDLLIWNKEENSVQIHLPDW